MNAPVRWGLTAAVIFLAGGVAGRCTGPMNGRALARIDSTRVANAAFDRGQAEALSRATAVHDSLKHLADSLRLVQPVRERRTDRASTGADSALAAVLKALDDSSATLQTLRPLVLNLKDSLETLHLAQLGERTGAQQALQAAYQVIRGDSAEIRRLWGENATVRHQRDEGLKREERLARQGRGWQLAVTCGPGVSFDGRTIRGAPVQATVGLSRQVRLSLPKLF